MLFGTQLDKYMPEYYYYTDSSRGLIPLVDNEDKGNGLADFVDCLKSIDILLVNLVTGQARRAFLN